MTITKHERGRGQSFALVSVLLRSVLGAGLFCATAAIAAPDLSGHEVVPQEVTGVTRPADTLDVLRQELRELKASLDSALVVVNQQSNAISHLAITVDSARSDLESRLNRALGNLRSDLGSNLDSVRVSVDQTSTRVGVLDANTSNRLDSQAYALQEERDFREEADWKTTMLSYATMALALTAAFAVGVISHRLSTTYFRKTTDQLSMMDSKLSGSINERIEVLDRERDFLEALDATLEKTIVPHDHTLVLRLCNEITRVENNLSAMDPGIGGHKKLVRSIARIKNNLKARDYEIIEYVGRKYDYGMAVNVIDFISDPKLSTEEMVISRVITPEVRFGGERLQAASVNVSQGQ